MLSAVGKHNCSQLNNLTTNICTLIHDNDTADETFYNTARFITGLILYPILCLLGLTGNVFILVVFSKKSMDTSTNKILSALAVSDLIKVINDEFYFITCLLYQTNPAAGDEMFACFYPYGHYFFNLSTCVSSWMTVSVTVERYILVCHPIRAKHITSVPRAILLSTTVFVIMALISTPSFFRYKTVRVFDASLNQTKVSVNLTDFWLEHSSVSHVYNSMQSMLRSIIPLFLLVIFSSFIINSVRMTRANKQLSSRNRITVMLIVVIIFFLLCITPDAVMSVLSVGYAESESYHLRATREVTDTLLVLNASINFLLYYGFNKTFKKEFNSLLSNCCWNKYL
ncbi:hypothetical protein HELRODRAFT_163956 [Helobdella robusta]|uniref:G-protein coupled receptors family 1 profile domain-containing protein n=1 Tax=Helobdella robusta TaxID=6412 RepID=T1EUN6_HELRO|nr:hypothetical protein HELRODRAFT_163956 [Helobdella robusta]ESN94170.1 hypothetical protein HELRODRAFT_163956 [Helobdella robusta]